MASATIIATDVIVIICIPDAPRDLSAIDSGCNDATDGWLMGSCWTVPGFDVDDFLTSSGCRVLSTSTWLTRPERIHSHDITVWQNQLTTLAYLTRKSVVNWLHSLGDCYHQGIPTKIHVYHTVSCKEYLQDYMLWHKIHQTVFTYNYQMPWYSRV